MLGTERRYEEGQKSRRFLERPVLAGQKPAGNARIKCEIFVVDNDDDDDGAPRVASCNIGRSDANS